MSRLRLSWFNLTQKEGQDLCLKIPICDVYSRIIDSAFPDIEHIPWQEDTKGTCYTFVKKITDDKRERLNDLLEVLTVILCLTVTEHLKPHFTDELNEAYALDFNFEQNIEPIRYTRAGDLAHRAKYSQDTAAARELAEMLGQVIQGHPTFLRADIVAAVPARPSKTFHLPNALVSVLGELLNRRLGLQVSVKEIAQLKTLTLDHKISALADAFALNESVEGKTILLVDDLYQSGATLWSLAKFLKARGAREVYGLACVKSWRDTDNV
jgi:predicted amidophosphoribosyltransferase